MTLVGQPLSQDVTLNRYVLRLLDKEVIRSRSTNRGIDAKYECGLWSESVTRTQILTSSGEIWVKKGQREMRAMRHGRSETEPICRRVTGGIYALDEAAMAERRLINHSWRLAARQAWMVDNVQALGMAVGS